MPSDLSVSVTIAGSPEEFATRIVLVLVKNGERGRTRARVTNTNAVSQWWIFCRELPRTAKMNENVVQIVSSAPLGATVYPGGVNFSVFSKNATLVELLLFDDENAAQPARVIPLDTYRNRTYHYWHVFVPDLEPGQIYA